MAHVSTSTLHPTSSTSTQSHTQLQPQRIQSVQPAPQSMSSISGHQPHPGRRPRSLFIADLSQCLVEFVVQLLPPHEEVAVKEDVRKLLERLIRTVEPDCRLLSFGSTANGFELKNSDMDLCCLIDSKPGEAPPNKNPSQFVLRAAQLLERETKFVVKPLPNARIPIIKLSLQASPSIPFGIACDIGFENRLALENTRLLYTYAAIDPTRVRTLVLFLKLWSKRRKINNPYHGTLSSYGYALLVIYFLVHVKNPPVLPNLQQLPPLRPIGHDECHINGRNVWFFDDVEMLRQRWRSSNTESIADLLIDFFRYYAKEFNYGNTAISIRVGPITKEALETNRPPDPRDGTSLCIEDPFETDFNVGRCVTRDGLYTIRGEFMRASRIISTRPDRAMFALAQLCEDRGEDVPRSATRRTPVRHYPPSDTSRAHSIGAPSPTTDNRPYVPHRLSNASLASTASTSKSAQSGSESTTTTMTLSTPISISHPNGTPIILPTPPHLQQHSQSHPSTQPPAQQLQPPQQKPQLAISTGSIPNALAPPFVPNSAPLPIPCKSESMTPPPHMAPRRSKWTKPPSEHASPTRQSSFEERFANGLKLAVAHHPNPLVDRISCSPGSSATEDDEVGDDLLDAPSIRSSSPSQASSSGMASLAAEGRSGEEDEGTEREKEKNRNLNGRGRRPSVRKPFSGETLLPDFPPSSSTPRPQKGLCVPIPPGPLRGPSSANGGHTASEQGTGPSSVPNANAGMVLYPIPPFYHYQFQHHQPQMPSPSLSSSNNDPPTPYRSRSFDQHQQGGQSHSFSPQSHTYQKWNQYNTPPQALSTTMFAHKSIAYSDRPSFIHPNGPMQFQTPPQSSSPTSEARASPEISLAVPQAVGNAGS